MHRRPSSRKRVSAVQRLRLYWIALAISLRAESLRRCSRSQISSATTSGRLRSLRTRLRSCAGAPLRCRWSEGLGLGGTARIEAGTPTANSAQERRVGRLGWRHRLDLQSNPIVRRDQGGSSCSRAFTRLTNAFSKKLPQADIARITPPLPSCPGHVGSGCSRRSRLRTKTRAPNAGSRCLGGRNGFRVYRCGRTAFMNDRNRRCCLGMVDLE
jgi:hypothetical protein